MTTTLIATAYIYDLLEDPNIELIEVWANVLYARMRKGCGRNRFISKHNLEFHLPVYYNESEYKSISKRYHPDAQSGGSKRSKSKQSSRKELQQSINISRSALSGIFTGRRCNGIAFVRAHESFTKLKSLKSGAQSNKLVERFGEQLSKAGYSDLELFGIYLDSPLDESVGEYLQSDDDTEEALQAIAKAWADEDERLKREDPEEWNKQEELFTVLGL